MREAAGLARLRCLYPLREGSGRVPAPLLGLLVSGTPGSRGFCFLMCSSVFCLKCLQGSKNDFHKQKKITEERVSWVGWNLKKRRVGGT